MAPEPDAHAVLARAAYQRVQNGEDWIAVLLWVAQEAVRLERQQQALRAGWPQGEDTPTISAQEKLQRPSMRPTRPPPAPPPLGSFARGKREPTQITSVAPPPLPPKRRR